MYLFFVVVSYTGIVNLFVCNVDDHHKAAALQTKHHIDAFIIKLFLKNRFRHMQIWLAAQVQGQNLLTKLCWLYILWD